LNDCIEEVQIQSASSISRLYSPAREKALTRRNIKSGWAKAGLYPFSPDKVLRDIQKPLAELYVPREGEMKVESCPQSEVLQTPVTSEALTSLHSRIEQDAHVLDGPSKQGLQKLANAAKKSLAGCALLLDENRLLFEQNNESNCCQSTRSTVVGKAKVKENVVRSAKALHLCYRRLKGHGRAKWKLLRRKLKHWAWGITVLFYNFIDTSIFVEHFDEAERSASFCCALSQPLDLILIIQHSNIGIRLL
jgi:hypothetical protein